MFPSNRTHLKYFLSNSFLKRKKIHLNSNCYPGHLTEKPKHIIDNCTAWLWERLRKTKKVYKFVFWCNFSSRSFWASSLALVHNNFVLHFLRSLSDLKIHSWVSSNKLAISMYSMHVIMHMLTPHYNQSYTDLYLHTYISKTISQALSSDISPYSERVDYAVLAKTTCGRPFYSPLKCSFAETVCLSIYVPGLT